jgi:hypothetical protein
VAQRNIAAMAALPASLARDLTRITVPALVIHGTDDPLVPLDHGRALARLISGCRLGQLEGAGPPSSDTTSGSNWPPSLSTMGEPERRKHPVLPANFELSMNRSWTGPATA